MEKRVKIPDFCAAMSLFAVMVILMSVYAPYRIGFKEQISIFFWNPDRLSWYLSNPAVLAAILGDWLTQFYYHNWAGIVITVILLLNLWVGVKRLFALAGIEDPYYLVTLVPVVIAGAFMIMPNYPVSGLVGLIFSIWAAGGICHIPDGRIKVVSEGLAIPVLFVLAGGHAVTFALICVLLKQDRFRQVLLSVVVGLVLMLLLARAYNLSVVQAVLYPIVQESILPRVSVLMLLPLSVCACLVLSMFRNTRVWTSVSVLCVVAVLATSFRNPVFESSIKLGTLAYKSDWKEVRKQAEKSLDTLYGLYYRNLSYAREGRLPDALLECNQGSESEGLFLLTGYNENYLSTFFFIEALIEMGDISQAIDCALLGQTCVPGGYSTRMLRRLADISIIAGDYEVAGKYLNILSRTRYHRDWANNLMHCIENDSLPEQYLVWRSRTSERDRFFELGAVRSSLNTIATDVPTNKVAIDYLMCSCLLERNLESFLILYERFWLNALDRHYDIPVLYQEALLLSATSEDSLNEIVARCGISQSVADRYLKFMEAELAGKDSNGTLAKYGDTYWYYMVHGYKSEKK